MTNKIDINWACYHGRYSESSPVVGTRAHELTDLGLKISQIPVLKDLDHAIYKQKDIGHFLYIIPVEKKEEADAIASEIFNNYIAKYAKDGITAKNAVDWVNHDRWPLMYFLDTPGLHFQKTEDHSVGIGFWHSHATVRSGGQEGNGGYLPAHLIALHEFQHVEETEINKKEEKVGSELLPSLNQFILTDAIYKQVMGRKLEEEVDYKKDLIIGSNQIPVGRLVNFYRNLTTTYQSLFKAVISKESLSFLGHRSKLS